MDFYKNFNVDNFKNKIPSIPSMPTMPPIPNFQMPKMKSRKIFKTSKEDPSPRHMSKAISTTSLPPALPPSSFIDRSPTRISTISSLKSTYNRNSYVDENDMEEDGGHDDSREKHSEESSKTANSTFTEKFSKHYKEFSDFKIKHIFGKKTVVSKTEIEVNMYADEYRMDNQADEEEERRIFEQEHKFEFKFKEACVQSSDSQESFQRSDSMTSVVPTPERSRINALQLLPPPLSRRKNSNSEIETEKPKKKIGKMLWKSSENVIEGEEPSSSGFFSKSNNMWNIRGNKSKNTSMDALDEGSTSEHRNKRDTSTWTMSNFGFKKSSKVKGNVEEVGGNRLESDAEHSTANANIENIDEQAIDKKSNEIDEPVPGGSKFWQPENGWRKPKFRFRKSAKEQKSIDDDSIEKETKPQPENIMPSRFWQPENGWRKPNIRFRKSLKSDLVEASADNPTDNKNLPDDDEIIKTQDISEEIKKTSKPTKRGRGGKIKFYKDPSDELPSEDVPKTSGGNPTESRTESNLLSKARDWKNKSIKNIKSISTASDKTDKGLDSDSGNKNTTNSNKRVWKMKSLKKSRTLSREVSDTELDENELSTHASGQKPQREGIYAKLKTLAKNPLNKIENDNNGMGAKPKQSKLKSSYSKDGYKSDVEEDNYENVESKPPRITKFWKKTKEDTLHDVTDEVIEQEDHSTYGKLKKWTFNIKDKSSAIVDVDNEPANQSNKPSNLMDKLKTKRTKKSQSCDEINPDETSEDYPHATKKLSNMEKIENCKEKAKLKMVAQMERIKNFHASKSKDSEDSTHPQHQDEDYFDHDDIKEIHRPSPAQWAAQQNFSQSIDSLESPDLPNILLNDKTRTNTQISQSNIIIRPVSPVPTQLASTLGNIIPISTFLAPPPPSNSPQEYGKTTDWIPNRQIISSFFQNSPSVPSKLFTEIPTRGHARKQSIDSNDSDSWIPDNYRNIKLSPIQSLNKIEEKYEPWKPQSLASEKKIVKEESLDIFTNQKSGAFADFEDVMKNVPVLEIKNLDDLQPKTLPPAPPPPSISPPPPPLPKRKHNLPERTESMVNLAKPLIKQSSLRRRFSDSLDSDEFNFGVVNKLIEQFEKPPADEADNQNNNNYDDYDDDDDYNDKSPEHIQVIAIIESKGLNVEPHVTLELSKTIDSVPENSEPFIPPTDIKQELRLGASTISKPQEELTDNFNANQIVKCKGLEIQLPDDIPPPPPTQPPPELDDDDDDSNKIKNNNNNNIPIIVVRKHSTTKRHHKKKIPRPTASENPIKLDENQNVDIEEPSLMASNVSSLPTTSSSSASSKPCAKNPITEITDTRPHLKMPLFVSGPLTLPITTQRTATGTRGEDDMFFSFESDEGITV